MFTNTKITHKTYGNGTVISEELADNLVESRLIIEFDNGDVRKFALKGLTNKSIFTEVPENVRILAADINAAAETAEAARLKAVTDSIKNKARLVRDVCNLDEERKPVTFEQWQKAYKVAGEYRWPYESRAVIMDGVLYIHATAALATIDLDHKHSNKAYKACEDGKKYQGATWAYATRADIEKFCLKGEE